MTEQRKGLLQGVLAYGLWGGVAAYWKLLDYVDPFEVVAHRAVWGFVAFAAFVLVTGQLGALRRGLRDGRTVIAMAGSAVLLAINWILFVWATNTDRLLDASLGYFINPLVSVALGTIVLRERMSKLQWVAVGCATLGVAILTWRVGKVPWVALVLAFAFGGYGLVRKTATVDALAGSAIETLLILPVAVIYLLLVASQGALGHADAETHALLVGTGLVTAVPLVLFTSAARRLPLSTIGLLQTLVPTGQFLLAVGVYGEPLALDRLAAFIVIWIGLAVFTVDLVQRGTDYATRSKQT